MPVLAQLKSALSDIAAGVALRPMAQELMHIKPNIPIILCTGFSATIDEQKARAMGIRAFVLKPIVKREIAATIRKVLDQTVGKPGNYGAYSFNR